MTTHQADKAEAAEGVVQRNTGLVAISMFRPNLDGLPVCPPPAGFTLRFYRPGDAATWTRIHEETERHREVTPELFGRVFGGGEAQLPLRQLFLCDEAGREIGTGTAWFNDDYYGLPWGRVHWVAVAPQYQGRGLGRVLTAAVCQRLRELGHARAYLKTESVRLAAIALYLDFGFVPEIKHGGDRREWEHLRAQGLKVVLPDIPCAANLYAKPGS
jgi:GNAT superfamily N-acetyltransferase